MAYKGPKQSIPKTAEDILKYMKAELNKVKKELDRLQREKADK